MNKVVKPTFLYLTFLMVCCKGELTDPASVDTLNVSAHLSAGYPIVIDISIQNLISPYLKILPGNIDALKVLITKDGSKTDTLTPLGRGQYTDSSLIVSDTCQYSISFVVNGKTVMKSTPIPSESKIFGESGSYITVSSKFNFRNNYQSSKSGKSNPNDSFYIVVVKNEN